MVAARRLFAIPTMIAMLAASSSAHGSQAWSRVIQIGIKMEAAITATIGALISGGRASFPFPALDHRAEI